VVAVIEGVTLVELVIVSVSPLPVPCFVAGSTLELVLAATGAETGTSGSSGASAAAGGPRGGWTGSDIVDDMVQGPSPC